MTPEQEDSYAAMSAKRDAVEVRDTRSHREAIDRRVRHSSRDNSGVAWDQTRMRRVHVNGVDLEYHEEGEGIPVVFSHGSGSDLRFWKPQHRAFAEHYRFVAYSRRSFGSSEGGPDGGAAADDHAGDLVALIGQLEAGPVHLVGFSAATSLLAALRAHDFLRTLTIVEPNVPSLLAGDEEGETILAWWRNQNDRVRAEAGDDPMRQAELWFELVNNQGPGRFGDQPAAFREMWMLNMTMTRPAATSVSPLTCDRLRELPVPTLALGAEHGMPYSRLIVERLAACLPDCQFVVVPAVTHFMSYQAPTTFNDLVLDFLAGR